jgi:hypothetical protein
MGKYRLKHSFTSGELSPMMDDRVDFERFKNGCKKLYNAVCATQGPGVRRPGFEFIYNLNELGLDISDSRVRTIPFIFNENQAYAMIFYMHVDGSPRMVLGTEEGLVVYGAVPITECPPGTPVTPAPGSIVTLTLPSTWDIENFDWAQTADEMHITQSGLQPYIITRFDAECWTLTKVTYNPVPVGWPEPTNPTDPLDSWVYSAAELAKGWPERVTFHQQRLVYAANILRRQTVWASAAGDFTDFDYTVTTDSSAVTFTLNSGTQNKIRWITSGKSLHVGTLGDEWTVTGNDRASLTPTNILAQRQTNNGSESNKPLLIGLTTMFVERHGRTINEFVYDYTYDSYKTSDMAILSTHITEKYSITDWAYQQTPDSIIWCVRSDGDLIGITYQRQHKVVGWHHHDTLGEFKAVTCIPGSTREDDVWAIVKRSIGGSEVFYVEKLSDWFKGDLAEDGRFLDSFGTYTGSPVSSVTATHLAGETVDILADGTVHPPVVVGTLGEVPLNNSYSTVVVGLPYVSEIRPLLTEVGGTEGTSLGRMQRITSVMIDFYKTLGCYLGRVDEEGTEFEEEIPFRTPGDITGQQVPLFTGWRDIGFPEGFDRKSEYFIRQKQPLPMTIRSVVDSVEVYD